jgi:hypothetical protein
MKQNQKIINSPLGIFHRALETKDFVYFVKYDESDENGSTKMYRKVQGGLELISDNYFASSSLIDDVINKDYTWASPSMKKNIDLIQENYA